MFLEEGRSCPSKKDCPVVEAEGGVKKKQKVTKRKLMTSSGPFFSDEYEKTCLKSHILHMEMHIWSNYPACAVCLVR